MAINEQIVTGRKFRKCIDVVNKIWLRMSFWTKACDVEFEDGKNAEEKLDKINETINTLNESLNEKATISKLGTQCIFKLSGTTLTITPIKEESEDEE